nr:S8 family peptidase [Eubacterium sp.]
MVKQTEDDDTLHNYVVHVKNEDEFGDMKAELKQQGKLVSRHKKSDDNLLYENQSVTAEMTADEAKELKDEEVLVEKDIELQACEATKCVAVEPDLPEHQKGEHTDNPKKFKPCKAINDPKKKNEVVSWNIACVAGTPHENKYKGKGVKVAVIDSGIDTHDELNTKDWVDFSDKVDGYKPIDSSGHGTQMAGVIAARINGLGMEGIAEKAEIYSVKILDSENKASISAVVKALEWCIQNDIDIISMSFGTNEYSEILHDVIKKAEQQDILMIASAGNNQQTIQYPARYPEVISVGSINEKLVNSDFSANSEVDLVAPGEDVQTIGYLGTFTKTEGTSIAAAHVTGVAAAVMSAKKSMKSTELRSLLESSAIVLENGTNLVNYENAINQMKKKGASPIKAKEIQVIAEEKASDEDSIVEGSWNARDWKKIDNTGHFTIINNLPLSYFGKGNESDTQRTYNRWITARASYQTDKLPYLSASSKLAKYNRNAVGEVDSTMGGHCYPPYHANAHHTLTEVTMEHLQFLYELARRRLILNSNLDLVATNYNGDYYYGVYIGRKMKRRIIVDLKTVHEQLKIDCQNNSINMNTIQSKGYMVLGVFLHLVADIQAHRAQVSVDMMYAKPDGTIYYPYDHFVASREESRINLGNLDGVPSTWDTYWKVYGLVKAGELSMNELKQYMTTKTITITCNGQTYTFEKEKSARAYEDNPYFWGDRIDTARWFVGSYIDRMRGDTGTNSAHTGYFYAVGRVPLC